MEEPALPPSIEGEWHGEMSNALAARRQQALDLLDPNLTIEEASELSANARRAALAMFPGKELAFDILYKPRLQRLMTERFRIQ